MSIGGCVQLIVSHQPRSDSRRGQSSAAAAFLCASSDAPPLPYRSSQRELRISISNALCGGAAQKQRLAAQLRAWGPCLGAQLWWGWRLAQGLLAWHLWVMWGRAVVEAARLVRHPKEWRATLR